MILPSNENNSVMEFDKFSKYKDLKVRLVIKTNTVAHMKRIVGNSS